MDPFREEIFRERRTKLLGLAALVAFVGLLVAGYQYLLGGPQQVFAGQVLRFGSYAFDDGDRPLVLVRLPDGSEREMRVGRNVVMGCRVGDRISLIRTDNFLRVSPEGCPRRQTSKP